MKLVIEMEDKDYNRIKDIPDAFDSLTSRAYKAIKNGIPLPKGHGRLIDCNTKVKIESGSKTDMIFGVTKVEEYTIDELLKNLNVPTIIEADKEVSNDVV